MKSGRILFNEYVGDKDHHGVFIAYETEEIADHFEGYIREFYPSFTDMHESSEYKKWVFSTMPQLWDMMEYPPVRRMYDRTHFKEDMKYNISDFLEYLSLECFDG